MRAPIALLLLVKNEERWIARCIRPLRRHVREIIVMDTGSRDDTQAIAHSMGARIIKDRMNGDFAEMRNRLISQADQPWILFLDADEILSPKDVRVLVTHVQEATADAFNLEIRHYTDEYNLLGDWTPCSGAYAKEERLSGKSGFYRYARPLLFRSHSDIRYEYPIHESLLPALKRGRRRVAPSPIAIHHFEFAKGTPHHVRKHRKYLQMELRLLKTMPRDCPCYPMMLQSAAVDIVSTEGDLSRAARYCKQLIALAPRDERHRMLKARVAMLRGRFQEAHEDLQASIAIKATPDNLCLAAWNKMELGDASAAIRFLDRALSLRCWHPVSLNLMGIISANERRSHEALIFFGRALESHPRYADCLLNRAVALLGQGRKAQAIKDLRRVQELTTDRALLKRTRSLLRRTGSGKKTISS